MKHCLTLGLLLLITTTLVHAQVVTDPWATIGNQARAIAVDSVGNVYTANGYNSTVSKITPSGTLTLAWATLATGTGPGAIAVDALGNVYTANTNSTISKINSTGTVTQTWSFTGQPLGLVIDASNNIYCSNYTNSTVMKISAGGTLTNPWVSLASGTAPMSIAIDASGNLYTPNYNNVNGTVSKITPSGSLTQTYATITSAPGGYPTFIHVDRFGNLYGSTTNYTVYKITSSGTLTDPWATLTNTGGNTQKLVTDALGNVYATSNTTSLVSKITPSGTVTASWVTLTIPCCFSRPRGMVIDSSGNLYVVNSSANTTTGHVTKIATYNTWLGTTSTDWRTATNWSFGAVPVITDNIVIATASNQPVISTSTAPVANNFTMNSGTTLTLNGTGLLYVYGDINNSGTISGTGNVGISVSAPKTISGIGTWGNITTLNNTTISASNTTQKVTGSISIGSGTLTTNGNLVIAPGAYIASAAIPNISGTVTLQQNIIGQRGWRVFANPFSTPQTIATVASNNGITIGTTASSASSLTDSRTFSNATNTWSNVTGTTWAANTPYSLFIRGLATEVTGSTYTGGPTAFTYNVSGTLNGASTSITPNSTSNFLIAGNPYAAPVNTQALTGGTAKPYYTYQIAQGGSSTLQRTKAGSWVAAGSNSNTTNTIPVLGVLAYQPSSTSTYNINTTDINTSGTLQTGLFGVNNNKQLELLVEQNGDYQDKVFVRLDAAATAASTDNSDLQKLYNDNVNVYTINKDQNLRLAVDARKDLNDSVSLGISGLPGNYNFKVSSDNLPDGTTVTLLDKFLNTTTELKTGTTYNFTISSDTASKGENRFVLSFSNKTQGVVDNSAEIDVQVSPNPVTDQLTISLGKNAVSQSSSTQVRILTINGQPLQTQLAAVGAKTIKIALGKQSKSVLVVQVQNDKINNTQKIIKN